MKNGLLAKECGYRDGSNRWTYYSKEYGIWYSTNVEGGISKNEKTFQQCTQTELQTWLRKKGIEVYVIPKLIRGEVDGYFPMYHGLGEYTPSFSEIKKTYERAMEDGLLLALKHLKPKKK